MAKKKKAERLQLDNEKEGWLNLNLLLELAGVVASSTRNREPGQAGIGNFGVNWRKLGWGVAGVAGQQVMQGFGRRRRRRQLSKELAAGLISQEDFKAGRSAAEKRAKEKKNRFGPGMIAGAVVGGALYLLSMPPENRTRLFQQIDAGFNQVAGLLNELQGKPYSDDYEEKKS